MAETRSIRQRFPPPWRFEEVPGGYRVTDAHGTPLAYVYGVDAGARSALLAGPLPVVANPVRLASHDTTAPKSPPLLGEDTEAVLSGLLGLSAAEIAELRREGVV
jgi:crotonobetainyl-CoA:carnitine CoA-transferase CaiB-like acyl-CoA transferase